MENNFVNILEDFVEKNKNNDSTFSQSKTTITVDEPFENDVNDYQVLEKQLLTKETEYNELKDKYIRTLAEYDNFRKRTFKEKNELRENGHIKAVETILPIVDDFERALNNLHDDAKEGVMLIYNKFMTTLNTLGVEKITVEKNVTPFDTNLHDAITMVDVTDENLNQKVIDSIQTGYTLHGKVIRHSKVIVGNFLK